MRFKNAAKVLFGITALAIVIWMADLRSVVDSLSRITLFWLVVLAALSFVMLAVSTLKWQLFLDRLGSKQPFFKLFNLYLLGYFINTLMPSYVGGDVVRSLYVDVTHKRHDSLVATFLERFTGLAAMIIIAFVCSWISPLVTPQIRIAVGVVFLGLVVGTVCSFSRSSVAFLDRFKFPQAVMRLVVKTQEALRFGVADPGLIFTATLLSFAFHFLTVVNTMAVAYAVGWNNPSFLDLCVVVPLILLVGAIPVAPSGLGITEGAFFYFLTRVGATPDQAVGIALVLRAKSYVLALLGGLVWFRVKRADKDGGVLY